MPLPTIDQRLHRRLRNSLVAVAAACLVAAGTLAVGVRAPAVAELPDQAVLADAASPATDADFDSDGDAGDTVTDSTVDDSGPTRAARPARRSRQTVAMPFFSFARS